MLAVRMYQDRTVHAQVIHRIVEAARLTPSSGTSSRGTSSWSGTGRCCVGSGDRADRAVHRDAAFAVVVAYEKASPFGVSDASLAIHSMMLTAWAEGVGSNWVGLANRFDAVKPLHAIPDDLDVLAIAPFGYPVSPLGKGKKKPKALSEVAHRERFGHPFA